MTERSRFWGGTTTGDAGEAPYDADTEFAAVLRSLAGADNIATYRSGVFQDNLNELAVTGAVSPVAINTGRALVYGTWYENDASVNVAIPTPSVSTRVDVIVLRKDWAAQTVRITRVAGTEGGGVPALTTTAGTVWDMPLAEVSITTGGAITLTDRRSYVQGPLSNSTPANVSTVGAAGTAIEGSRSDHVHDIANGAIDAAALIANGVITDVQVAAANKDGAAGVYCMRTLGLGASSAAAGNHTHTLQQEAVAGIVTAGDNTGGSISITNLADTGTRDTDTTINPSKTCRVAAAATGIRQGTGAGVTLDLYIDGVLVTTTTITAAAQLTTISGTREVASGARVLRARITNNTGGAGGMLASVGGGAISV